MALHDFLAEMQVAPLRSETITVAGIARTVFARELTGDEMEQLADGLRNDEGTVPVAQQRELRNRIVAHSLCDAAGAPRLAAADVGQLPYSLLDKVSDFVYRVNGLARPSEGEEKKG